MQDERNAAGTFLMVVSAFVGGIGLGMLLAPRSGEETRRFLGTQVRKQSDAIARQARKASDDAAKRYLPLYDDKEEDWQDVVQSRDMAQLG